MRRLLAFALLAVLVLGLWRCSTAFEADGDEVGTVTVFGPWLGTDADHFVASANGVGGTTIRYTGSLDFDEALRSRVVAATDVPDIAAVPAPGLIDELAATEQLVPFSDEVVDALAANYPDDAWESVDGEVYSFPYRTIVKSLVWYRPDVFAEHGWTVPATLDELTTLADEIQLTTDIAPWCFGVFSGQDTGWPATDWVEDLLLRRAGTTVYDDWVDGTRGFDDPAVRSAFEEFRSLVLDQGRLAGDIGRLLETPLSEIDDPLFADEPGCAMYKQASFGTIWFPPDTSIGPSGDVDAFVLPGVTAGEPPPLLVSEDRIVQLTDRPVVDRVVAHLVAPDGARAWAEQGGFISERSSVDLDDYYRPDDRRLAELLLDASTTRFDASDQFPPAQRDAFLDAITAWVAGTLGYDDLAVRLDALRTDPG